MGALRNVEDAEAELEVDLLVGLDQLVVLGEEAPPQVGLLVVGLHGREDEGAPQESRGEDLHLHRAMRE